MAKARTFVLCDGKKLNSYGFRVDPQGIDLERFRSNPVMLYRHDASYVIGRWENVRLSDGKLLADAVFDEQDEESAKIAGKVERGFIKGCSMGIRILDMCIVDNTDTATRSELHEASVCPIPSDAGAIALYDENRKKLTYEEVRLQFNNHLKPIEMPEKKENQNVEQQLEAKTKELESKDKELQAKDQEIAQLKGEIAKGKSDAVKSYLEAAVAAGKISESEKENFQKLAESDFETVKKIIDEKKPKASQSLKDLAAKTASESDRSNWTYLEWMKKDSDGLSRMKKENPSEFERLKSTLK